MAHNPPVVPLDTSYDVWKRQMAAIAARSVEERLEEWAELNRLAGEMEANGIRRRHPDYTDNQVLRAMARQRYGDALVLAAWPGEDLITP